MFRRLFKIIGKLWIVLVCLWLVILVNELSYTYFPIFMLYLVKRLAAEPGVNLGGVSGEGSVNLPEVVINFFNSITNIQTIIVVVAVVVIALQVFRAILRVLDQVLRGILLERSAEKLRNRLYAHVQNLTYEYLNKVDTGDLIQRVTTDVSTTTGFVSGQLSDIVRIIGAVSFGSYQLYFLSKQLCLIMMLSIIPVAIASVIYFKYAGKYNKATEEAESKMINTVQENIQSARIVKAFGNEKFEIEKMEKYNTAFAKADTKIAMMLALFWPCMDLFASAQYLAVHIYSRIVIGRGLANAAEMIAAFGVVASLIWPVRSLGRMIASYTQTTVSVKRLYEILDLKEEYMVNGTETPTLTGNIVFDNVSFSFPDNGEEVLKGLSFEIKAGETVAFVGKTGCGKSTIVNLLLRMYEYNNGSILLDGIELKNIDKHTLRKQIGVVFQDPFLFSKTIHQNIAITDERITREQVEVSAKEAALFEDVMKFNAGFDTLVGEKGTSLSGGQKQRVAIARILVNGNPILVFDDALSAVDTRTDTLIRDALLKRENKQTLMIITHRITTAKEASKIIVLDKGRVESIGTHEELIKKDGLYSRLWSIQGKLESEFLESIKGIGGEACGL